MPAVKRVLLKLSGEVLMGEQTFGIDPATVASLAREVKAAKDGGLDICLVIGGGNIFRGMAGAAAGMDRAQADYMGMLATVMNALAMQNALEQMGVDTRVQSAVPMDQVCEPVIRRRAERHLEKGRVVIFAAGVGSPYFTTDSGAALRAAEMKCDALLKGTSVDGVYDSDPKLNPAAKRFETVSYDRVLGDNLRVMDASAVALCRDNGIPIVVFSIREPGNLARVLSGHGVQTIVQKEG
jgi:uridylate kinase